MSQPASSSGPRPILDLLRERVEHGVRLRNDPDLTRDRLQTWSSLVRMQLQKIYGEGTAEIQYFSSLPSQMTKLEIQKTITTRSEHLDRLVKGFQDLPKATASATGSGRVFIGHGRSPLWRELKEFVEHRLRLPCDEFNSTPVAGYTTTERLESLLSQASFAFLTMTPDDELIDARVQARPNVIHEIGLFQGRLGARRAIILVEEGCSEFSNIVGLTQIRFPRGDISARFEQIRLVLEREGLVSR